MCDDFNVPLAVSYVHEQAKIIHELARSPKRPKPGAVRALAEARLNLVQGARLLGLLNQPALEALRSLRDQSARQLGIDQGEVEAKIAARAQARADKEWERADAIRDELLAERVEIMDSPDGTSWRILYEKPS